MVGCRISDRNSSRRNHFSFDNFSVANPQALQVPYDASVKISFDTLQIIDDINVPYGRKLG